MDNIIEIPIPPSLTEIVQSITMNIRYKIENLHPAEKIVVRIDIRYPDHI